MNMNLSIVQQRILFSCFFFREKYLCVLMLYLSSTWIIYWFKAWSYEFWVYSHFYTLLNAFSFAYLLSILTKYYPCLIYHNLTLLYMVYMDFCFFRIIKFIKDKTSSLLSLAWHNSIFCQIYNVMYSFYLSK